MILFVLFNLIART